MVRFVARWPLANLAGFAMAAVLFVPVTTLIDGPVHKGLAGLALGVGIGAGQWLLLRRHLDNAAWWIPATVVGLVLVGAVVGTGTTDELASRGLRSETVGFVLGAAAGLGQWVVLRSISSRAAWWIPASAVAFGLGWFLMWMLDFELYSDEILPGIANLFILVVPFVAVSGPTLWWILDAHHREQPAPARGAPPQA